MSRDKQISEMAKAICHAPTCEIRKNGGTCYKYCKAYIYATRAIDKGYAKASEVAEEIFAEIEDTLEEIKDDFRADGDLHHASAVRYSMIRIAELKKKYLKSENDNG